MRYGRIRWNRRCVGVLPSLVLKQPVHHRAGCVAKLKAAPLVNESRGCRVHQCTGIQLLSGENVVKSDKSGRKHFEIEVAEAIKQASKGEIKE